MLEDILTGEPILMKERPILFSGEMVHAILTGRKTQTRRVIKDEWWRCLDHEDDEDRTRAIAMCPYGVAGDVLWVRETWQALNTEMKWWHEWPADDRISMNWGWTNPVMPAFHVTPPRWLPAIHMPRMACRIRLEIVDVRVERVQDISEADAIAEGMDKDALVIGLESGAAIAEEQKCRAQFADLWDRLNEKRGVGWDVNPWVWVIAFKRVQL